jgi:hypothetical protein
MINRFLLAACLGGALLLHAPAVSAEDMIVKGWEHCAVHLPLDVALPLRAVPDAGAEIVAGRDYGECGMILVAECENGWCPIALDGVRGWVEQGYIAGIGPAAHCNDYGECDIQILPYWMGGWQKIRTGIGLEGWIPAEYLWAQ